MPPVHRVRRSRPGPPGSVGPPEYPTTIRPSGVLWISTRTVRDAQPSGGAIAACNMLGSGRSGTTPGRLLGKRVSGLDACDADP